VRIREAPVSASAAGDAAVLRGGAVRES